eukprot:2503449-Pyramimonas_sp.AAC.1
MAATSDGSATFKRGRGRPPKTAQVMDMDDKSVKIAEAQDGVLTEVYSKISQIDWEDCHDVNKPAEFKELKKLIKDREKIIQAHKKTVDKAAVKLSDLPSDADEAVENVIENLTKTSEL